MRLVSCSNLGSDRVVGIHYSMSAIAAINCAKFAFPRATSPTTVKLVALFVLLQGTSIVARRWRNFKTLGDPFAVR